MTTRIMLLLLALIGATSGAAAQPCSTVASRYQIAERLRLAAEERPVHITFRTLADGVKVPEKLKPKYPEEMTIVLQHEFKQLDVRDDRFEVVVWFKGYPERLTVPFAAIMEFWDRTEQTCSDR